ncbi:MAG: rhodanese-like domain-containing protein [Thermomicrobiales bacterium]
MNDEPHPSASKLVAEARGRTQNLSPEEVAAEVADGAILVDLRESEERVLDGTIADAIHAPRGMLEFYADPASTYHRAELDPAKRTILHCTSGGRSALAAETLKQLGYTDVAHLGGGINAWKESGHPVE